MALELYRSKRDFKTTPEPKGRAVKRKAGDLAFVVQKHAATRLHYDFRLELNGVLLSWAVPKGPSLDPADKRLAVHVEDHPIEYGDFEGVIPARQYGAGTVLLWDRGTWVPKEDAVSGYQKGRLKFDLHGQKLKGGWILVRTRSSQYAKHKAWLLIKEDDEFARRGADAHVVDGEPASVASGRSMDEIAAESDRVWHSNKSVAENVKGGARHNKRPRFDLARIEGARKRALPTMLDAKLATLVKELPDADGWVHEMKFDGYRMLCRIEAGKAVLYSRNRKDWSAKFPAIGRAAARLPVKSAWIDGEIVVIAADGRSSFQALQNALSGEEAGALRYYAFDLPYLNGYDLREVPLIKRKDLLQRLLSSPTGTLAYSGHVEGRGAEFLAQACKHGLEGSVSKRSDSPYRPARNRDWLKIKCGQRQEMVIGGFTDPEGSRKGLGALLLGVYAPDGKLRYSGKVGTGFGDAALTSLRARLDEIAQAEAPFSNPPRGAQARRAHWVRPELVAEIAFTEWTREGTLRHPSFQGLREDKKASEVVRETPLPFASGGGQADERPARRNARKANTSPRSGKRTDPREGTGEADSVAGVKLTNPTKVLYPEANVTKRDLALYYESVGERILPHLRGRPLTLVRCPNGWAKQCFYQKHADQGVSDLFGRVKVRESDGTGIYMMANSIGAVVAAAQMGALELHPWGSRAPKLGYPDRMIFDLDPDEDLAWSELAEAAQLLHTLLDALGLECFLKTTGGKGLHVVVPVRPTLPWETVKSFSKAIAELLARTFPDRFTSNMSKRSRTGKIYVDYLRNSAGATAIAPYATRAKTNAPVATPISWKQLDEDVRFDHFNARNVPLRLARQRQDPWAGFFDVRQSVTKTMIKTVGYVEP